MSEPATGVDPLAGVIVIRTHYVDALLLDLAEALARDAVYEVVFAVDERKATSDTGRFLKISVTEDRLAALGVDTSDFDVVWKCGDYIPYLARHLRPAARYVWMLENDVLINFADPRDFFTFYDGVSSDDLLTSHFSPADENWFWWQTLKDRYEVVYRCFFPLVRLSARAIDFLLAQRQADCREGRRPLANDEAFVATVLTFNDFAVADFNSFRPVYDGATFNAWIVINRFEVKQVDDRLYHSVRNGLSFARGLRRKWSEDCVDLVRFLEIDPSLTFEHLEEIFVQKLSEELQGAEDRPEQVLSPGTAAGRLIPVVTQARMVGAMMTAMAHHHLSHCIDALRMGWGPLVGFADERMLNVALGKPAIQSSTCSWSRHQDPVGDAQRANDGLIEIDYGCHTDAETDAWWQVDLLAPYPVSRIRVRNRRDTPARSNNFHICCSLTGTDWTTLYEHPHDRPAEPEEDVRLPRSTVARYVRIKIPGHGIVTLREVEVYLATSNTASADRWSEKACS